MATAKRVVRLAALHDILGLPVPGAGSVVERRARDHERREADEIVVVVREVAEDRQDQRVSDRLVHRVLRPASGYVVREWWGRRDRGNLRGRPAVVGLVLLALHPVLKVDRGRGDIRDSEQALRAVLVVERQIAPYGRIRAVQQVLVRTIIRENAGAALIEHTLIDDDWHDERRLRGRRGRLRGTQ